MKSHPLYLNIGCGKAKLPGFVNIDRDSGADIKCDVTKGLPFGSATVDGIYSEHFIEHLTQTQIISFLRECRRVLKPGGRVRIATPDLDELVRQFYENDWQQPWLERYGFGWIRNRAEYLNVSLREWGHAWVVNEEELDHLSTWAGLERPQRCGLNTSTDHRLQNLETRPESILIKEYSKRLDSSPDSPLVSIVIPAFKPDFFAASLTSASKQTYSKLEILVLDDSPDGNIEEFTRSQARNDPRIKYLRNSPSLGEADNLTRGIRLASGEFIKPLYDDDVLEPDAIERLLNGFRAHPDARLAASSRLPINAAGEKLAARILGPVIAKKAGRLCGSQTISKILSYRRNLIGEPSCMMFRRKDALAIDEPNVMSLFGRICRGAGDVCLIMHLLSKGDLVYECEPTAKIRMHAGQTQNQAGFRQTALETWCYLQQQGRRLGFRVSKWPRLIRKLYS